MFTLVRERERERESERERERERERESEREREREGRYIIQQKREVTREVTKCLNTYHEA